MSISSWSNIACNVQFGRADKKQLKKDKVYKEILNAGRYGRIDVRQNVLNQHKKEPFQSVDELIGELQSGMVEDYVLMKKSLKMRIPDIDLESIIEKCEVDFEK